MNDPVAAALEQVTFVGAEPPSRPGPDPAVLAGLRAAAEASIRALPDPVPELPELAEPASFPTLQVSLDFVELISMVGEARAFDILSRLKEATHD